MFGAEASKIPPILVRLRTRTKSQEPGFAEGSVLVEAQWDSAQAPQRWLTQAAQGLCIIPWQQGRRVRLRFSHHSASGELELTHHEAQAGSAAELWLA
jgi:hypothetical protein